MKLCIHLDNYLIQPCEPLLRASDKEELQPTEATKKQEVKNYEQ